MQPWHIWLIAGLVMFVAEMLIPGFLVACLGVGCLGASVAALVGGGLTCQLTVFSVATMAALFALRPLMLKYAYRKGGGEATNVDAMAGKVGMVLETIEPISGKGRIKIGGENWKAVSTDGATILKDRKVRVTGVEGVTVTVEAVSDERLNRLGVVVETVNPVHDTGVVRVAGKDYPATTAADSRVEEGRKVRVVEVHGDKLVVEEAAEG
jgi:membrane protein implicated in regulation of membrane protease activity